MGLPALSPLTPDTANGVDLSELHTDRDIKQTQECRKKAKAARMNPCADQPTEALTHTEGIASAQYTSAGPASAQYGVISAITPACALQDVSGQSLEQGLASSFLPADPTKSCPISGLQTPSAPNSNSFGTWAAEAEALAAAAPAPLVDEVLRSTDLLQR